MMSSKQNEMNQAKMMTPGGSERTKTNRASVGNERKADVAGAQQGGSLAEAGAELRGQHPHGYADHGPHHGTSEHIRHKPHVRPNGGYGR